MGKVIRWFVRLGALVILWGAWHVAQVLMPGPSTLLTALHFFGLVCAVNFSLLAILATFYSARKVPPFTEEMRRHLHQEAQKGKP
jgi:hypothetical protein